MDVIENVFFFNDINLIIYLYVVKGKDVMFILIIGKGDVYIVIWSIIDFINIIIIIRIGIFFIYVFILVEIYIVRMKV